MGNKATLALWHKRQQILIDLGLIMLDDDIDNAERMEMVRARSSLPVESVDDSEYISDQMLLSGR